MCFHAFDPYCLDELDSIRRTTKNVKLQCLALCETGTRAGGEASAFPLSCSVMFFAYAAAVSTINVTKPHMYQSNIKVMFNRVNQH